MSQQENEAQRAYTPELDTTIYLDIYIKIKNHDEGFLGRVCFIHLTLVFN